MEMPGSRMLVESLLKEGVEAVFGIPGGAIINVYDELHKYEDKINIFLFRHEQGATHAADGYARSTGKPGVVIVTSGPGATNTVTAITTAFMDSSPLVVITGQVPTAVIGTDAFQEADVTGITMPITKANYLVSDVKDLPFIVKEAFYVATTGRPGPVLIDLPKDIQMREGEYEYPEHFTMPNYKPKVKGHPKQIKKAIELINNSKRPLILAGGGVNISNSMELLNAFIDKFNIPVVNTLMGYGLNPRNEKLYYGGIGMHGTVYGNYAIMRSDLIIALGTRFSDRILGDPKRFAPNAKIIHVDIDPAEIGKNVRVDIPIVGDVRRVLTEFLEAEITADFSEWVEELQKVKIENPLKYKMDEFIKPQYVIELVSRYFPDDTIVVADVGQNQMWVAQFYRFRHPRTFLSSGGLGTMGFALPAGIGAKIGNPDREVVVIAGDGGFQMNIQELMTINRYRIPLKIIVLDNRALGMVRQWQQLFFDSRYSSTILHDNPDFAELAKVVGIEGRKIEKPEEVEKAIQELAKSREPMLINALVDPRENVLPMVPSGKPLNEIITETPIDDMVIERIRGDRK